MEEEDLSFVYPIGRQEEELPSSMAHPQEPKVKLKFKLIYIGDYKEKACLLPKGYRLATVEEIQKNLDIFKWGRPIKTTGPSFEERTPDKHLLDGLIEDGDNFRVREGFFAYCDSIVAVKKKEWDSGVKKWRNCSAFYSSNGNSLRNQLYDGISIHTQRGIETAWRFACIYEDVELLYWLWQSHRYPFKDDDYAITHHASFPLSKMVGRLGSHGPRFQPQMENAREEVSAVLNYVIRKGRWDLGVPMVELFIEVYGQAFVGTAITFTNVENVPIFTKLLSLSLHQLEDQIPNIKSRFAEVLIEAVERMYSLLVTKMLEFKEYIDQIATDDCVRALRAAVGGGYVELVRSLLDLLKSRDGVKLPVEVDEKGKTLFHYALFHAQVFELLQETYAGLDDNVITRQDLFGRNILHWAAKGACDSQVVYHILDSISSAERLCYERDDRGRTPLHIAASKDDSGMIEKLLQYFENEGRIKYIQETGLYGQTALHMAAGEGHVHSVNELRRNLSDPLKERDGHKKTALHHAAQVKDPKAALATCKALLEHGDHDKRSLLLWASATGIGTADEMEDVHPHVRTYLQSQKGEYRQHLLRAAALNNYAGMAWEILNRGADMADIRDPDWIESLDAYNKNCVQNVISHMERMKEQGRDQPSMEDKLGRHVFAEGIAALLLNRFIESPITVGISGEWGMGKSSLMIQTEKILLITAAQLTFPNLLLSEQFIGAKKISLSTRGRKIYQQIKRGVCNLLALRKDKRPKETHIFADAYLLLRRLGYVSNYSQIYQQIRRWAHNFLILSNHESENPLVIMLTKYEAQYHAVYKSLACMDNNQMLQSKSVSQEQEHALRGVPRILTIRYNAWHYRDRHEAWAGLGVTITKEIEEAMTRAQWMSTCWRYTWNKNRVNIWIQVFLPFLLSVSLAGWVAWIIWMLLKQAKFQGLIYGSIPFTVITIGWVVLKSVISVVQPVSTQMLGYITSPDHTSHLGYQENVIDDINFLKKELGKKPHWFFSFILGIWCWNWFGLLPDNIENTRIPKFMPASEDQIRMVTFVDDLDRCEEEVILQVLSAVNLVLAECKINVILGTDKKMIERAIRRKFEDVDDEDFAEKFICKIIQIPLSLPDTTGEETNSFLEYHLGHEIPAKYIKKANAFESPRRMVVTVEPSRDREVEENSTSEEENVATVLNVEPSCNEPERGCRGISNRRVVDWLGRLLEFVRHIFRQPCEESSFSLRSAEGVRLIRELLLPDYTEAEANIFYELRKFASGNQKLPREWKRLLNYHKFAWYVLFRIGNVHSLPAWKEQLIGWIFVCWQWKHEMNHLIKNWHKYTIDFISKQKIKGKQRYCRGPLLSEIVAKIVAEPMDQFKISEIVAEPMDKFKFSQSLVPEGSNTTQRQEGLKMKPGGSLKQDPSMLCLYRDDERIHEGTSQNNWVKLQEALKIIDVSMEAIQLFQQFRLHCETNHLLWDV